MAFLRAEFAGSPGLALPPLQFNAAPEYSKAAELMLAGNAVEGQLLSDLLTARLRAAEATCSYASHS